MTKIFNQLKKIFFWLFNSKFLIKKKWASFLPKYEIKSILKPENTWLVMNGQNLRLSAKQSYAHFAIIAPSRSWKTTSFIVPNILNLDASMVITDPKGSLYRQTSGYLSQKWFDVQVINFSEPSASLGFNPFFEMKKYLDVQRVAGMFVASAMKGKSTSDPIWEFWPLDMMTCLLDCLKNQAISDFNNPPNLLWLLQNFGQEGEGLDVFVHKYGSQTAKNQWQAIRNWNKKTVKSFLTTLTASLSLFNDPEIASLFSRNEIDFSQLRKRKTAIFVQVNMADIKHFAIALNLFYISLFSSLIRELPETVRQRWENFYPVYLLLDEFWHYALPDMPLYLSFVGEYEVSISMILQSISQLYDHYWVNWAETMIQGGCSTKMFLSGLDIKTSQLVSQMLGREVETITTKDWRIFTSENNLKNADRLRVMKRGEAILFSWNYENMLIKTKPYFQNQNLLKKTKIPPLTLKKREWDDEVKFLQL